MTIRDSIIPADIPVISRVFCASWRHAYRGMIDDEYLDEMKDDRWVEFLQNGLADGTIGCAVAEDDTGVFGAAITRASTCPAYPDDGELACLYLLPENIGRGAGAALLQKAEELLLERDYGSYVLDVVEGNRNAIDFYLHHGFAMTEETIVFPTGQQQLICNVMRKLLR